MNGRMGLGDITALHSAWPIFGERRPDHTVEIECPCNPTLAYSNRYRYSSLADVTMQSKSKQYENRYPGFGGTSDFHDFRAL